LSINFSQRRDKLKKNILLKVTGYRKEAEGDTKGILTFNIPPNKLTKQRQANCFSTNWAQFRQLLLD